jgi:hypothetical protein
MAIEEIEDARQHQRYHAAVIGIHLHKLDFEAAPPPGSELPATSVPAADALNAMCSTAAQSSARRKT